MGGESVNGVTTPIVETGDLMIVAKTAWPDVLQPRAVEGQTICATAIHFNPNWLVRTIDCQGGANFYAGRTYGCNHPTFLPFAFGQGPSETFLVYRTQSAGFNP